MVCGKVRNISVVRQIVNFQKILSTEEIMDTISSRLSILLSDLRLKSYISDSVGVQFFLSNEQTADPLAAEGYI